MQLGWGVDDDLRCPLQALPELMQSFDGRNYAHVFSSVADHFSGRWCCSSEMLHQVPVLSHDTAETIIPNSLVRLRGMVVDMFNPEFFLGAYKASADEPWKPAALYTDAVPEDIAADAETRIMERRPLLLSAVPHEQPWATAAWAGHPVEPPTPSTIDRSKRAREPSSPAAVAGLRGSTPCSDKSDDTAAVKAPRRATGTDVDVPYVEADVNPSSTAHGQLQAERLQQQQQGAAAAAIDDEHQQQRPAFLPGDCIVQVYNDFDSFQLHDVVEVLGVVSVVPELAALQQARHNVQQQQQHGGDDAMAAGDGMDVDVDDDGFWQQEVAPLPPTSQVMRVHAFVVRKLPAYKSTTTSSSSTAGAAPAAAVAAAAAAPLPVQAAPRSMPGHLAVQVPLLRQQALNVLAAPLSGDMLAAEYLLLTTLGSVVSREDMGGAMGLLTLNITNVQRSNSNSSKASQLVPGLAAAFRSLLSHVALLPLTVPTLNTKRWYPQQCPATGRLFRGALQLTNGTLLLLDETGMCAGELGDAGVKNLQALRQVLLKQQLPCSCQVYTHNLHVNQPAVVLSEGRSVLRDSLALTLPLQPQQPVLVKPGQSSLGCSSTATAVVDWSAADVAGPEVITAAAAGMPELAAVRDYIAAARGLECRMQQSAAEACVARFRALQQATPGVGMEDLNTIITLSKLLSVSLGQEEFSIESWERAVQMEQLRKQRLAQQR